MLGPATPVSVLTGIFRSLAHHCDSDSEFLLAREPIPVRGV
jgi:hypothetical protein